ncbi:thiamine phosphate synthase [Dyadobacter luteus]|uniref:Thiamine-phosphate synthase n=1 Tax=Dyadobacter luteus TaxID=2259619 RepID=A0A3D8Y5P2_9BACT|nr:thiamine phosphate synthase [Dyadobacter luteus]REA57903.1 thiamine phosphate synthase [Dyadobacter luteus]
MEIEKHIQLYLVTDEKACLGRDFFWVVEEAVKGGVTMVQLREKELGTRAFIEKGKRLKDLLDMYGVPLIINDRVDVALAIDAAGVHVGQSDMPFAILKNLLPPEKITGLSVESKWQVQEAEDWNVSYIAASPLFSTPSKTDTESPWGMSGLRWMRDNTHHPVVVIGGLSETNTKQAITNGAKGIAVISAICSAPSPYEAAQNLRARIVAGVQS